MCSPQPPSVYCSTVQLQALSRGCGLARGEGVGKPRAQGNQRVKARQPSCLTHYCHLIRQPWLAEREESSKEGERV
jgi:hypothetical protein